MSLDASVGQRNDPPVLGDDEYLGASVAGHVREQRPPVHDGGTDIAAGDRLALLVQCEHASIPIHHDRARRAVAGHVRDTGSVYPRIAAVLLFPDDFSVEQVDRPDAAAPADVTRPGSASPTATGRSCSPTS